MLIVNLFCIPFISLYIAFKRENEPMVFGLKAVMRYAIYVVLNVIVSFLCLKVTQILIGLDPSPESQAYTLAASVIAFLIPYVHEIIRKYVSIRFEVNERS